jgi:hypothetical protein
MGPRILAATAPIMQRQRQRTARCGWARAHCSAVDAATKPPARARCAPTAAPSTPHGPQNSSRGGCRRFTCLMWLCNQPPLAQRARRADVYCACACFFCAPWASAVPAHAHSGCTTALTCMPGGICAPHAASSPSVSCLPCLPQTTTHAAGGCSSSLVGAGAAAAAGTSVAASRPAFEPLNQHPALPSAQQLMRGVMCHFKPYPGTDPTILAQPIEHTPHLCGSPPHVF